VAVVYYGTSVVCVVLMQGNVVTVAPQRILRSAYSTSSASEAVSPASVSLQQV